MDQITKGEQSKEKLILCAAQLFIQKGYNATGINDILSNAGMTKGSFYFYFTSKKDLALKVAEFYSNKINSWISKTAEGRTWEEFISLLVSEMIENAKSEKHFGCPIAVLGLEIAFAEPDIADYYSESLKKLITIFAGIFEFSGITASETSAIAHRAFAIYEGYLLYYRISKDINVLSMMLHDLIAIYENYKEVEI